MIWNRHLPVCMVQMEKCNSRLYFQMLEKGMNRQELKLKVDGLSRERNCNVLLSNQLLCDIIQFHSMKIIVATERKRRCTGFYRERIQP